MTPDRRVVPFKRWHYEWLRDASRSAEGGVSYDLSDEIYRQLEASNSWTAVVDGDPIMCAGTLQQWPGRHTAWAYVARGTLPHLMWMTEQARANLERVPGRIEFTVRTDFPAGHRWAKSLGFEVETPVMKAFGPQGESHTGYVRIN